MEEKNLKEERIKSILLSYYSRNDIKEAMFKFAKDREVVPSYMMQSLSQMIEAIKGKYIGR